MVLNANSTVNLFGDAACTLLSGNPISLDVNDGTTITQPIMSVSITALATCNTGMPRLFISDMLDCQAGSFPTPPTSSEIDHCFHLFVGLYISSLAFGCSSFGFESMTSITTLKPTIASNPAVGKSATASSEPSSLLGTLPTSSSTPQSSLTPTSVLGLSLDDQIQLGLGIGFGIPMFILAVWTLRYMYLGRFF